MPNDDDDEIDEMPMCVQRCFVLETPGPNQETRKDERENRIQDSRWWTTRATRQDEEPDIGTREKMVDGTWFENV